MAGGGLIIGGVVVFFLGFLFFSFAIDSEKEARDACNLADAGVDVANETCDSKDRKFIGLQSTLFILAVMAVGILLIVLGSLKLYHSK